MATYFRFILVPPVIGSVSFLSRTTATHNNLYPIFTNHITGRFVMQKVICGVFVVIIVSLFIGCASMRPQREVHDNTVTSTYPNVAVKIDPSFQYLGNPSEGGTSKSVSGSRDLKISRDSYCFVAPEKDIAFKALAVQFHKTETYFVSDFFGSAIGLEKGATDLSGKKYQYFTRAVRPSMDSHLTRHITDCGYSMPFGLMKVYGRVYGAKGNILVKVYYYESLHSSGLSDASWKKYDELNNQQQEYLHDFNARADSLFELIK